MKVKSTLGAVRTGAAATLLAAGALVGLVGLGGGGGCSLLLDFQQCQQSGDCAGAEAQCVEGICQSAPTTQPQQLQAPCDRSFGPWHSEDALTMGVVLSLSSAEAEFGTPLLKAMELAVDEINSIGGAGGKQLALVICDAGWSGPGAPATPEEVAVLAARRLIEHHEVPVILGPDSSNQTVAIATEVTIPQGVLLISPTATAVAVAELDDDDRVWRTTPSDAFQAKAMGALIEDLLVEELGVPLGEARVALLTRANNVYAQGLRKELVLEHLPAAIAGSGEALVTLDYQHEGSGPTRAVATLLESVSGDEPDLVVILGYSEVWEMMAQLDSQLINDNVLYLVPDAVKNLSLAQMAPDALEGRVYGTAPQNTAGLDYPPYKSFELKFRSKYGEDPGQLQFVANAFDAVYLVALAAVAGGWQTGDELAAGMRELSKSGAVVIAPETEDALQAFTILQRGDAINFQGASGSLDFNEKGEPSTGAIGLWCFSKRAVPEKGLLLDEEGAFHGLRCAPGGGMMPGADMGTMGDMGTMSDMGPMTSDMGTMSDMGPMTSDM